MVRQEQTRKLVQKMRSKKKQIFTAVMSLLLIFTMVVGCLAMFTACSENEIRNVFNEKKGKGDLMYIYGQKRKIKDDLYTEMFNCVKDLNKIKNKTVDKDYLGKEIYKAKQYGTYIHLAQRDGKYVTYIKTKDITCLWGEIPDRTNATGSITHGEAYYYQITPQLKAEIKKAEEAASKDRPDEVIPK